MLSLVENALSYQRPNESKNSTAKFRLIISQKSAASSPIAQLWHFVLQMEMIANVLSYYAHL